ncbi:MAG: DNA mismatch repair endonuclease MutL, partial [Clostridia bacterium]|nr:DNA mismatch repair endonuclease MutL [Clostridia bacterium]
DKIAAGEVVERPASVIKELLENSVDAKATVITVEIKNGGIKYMRVTDNGIGMSKEDAKLSIIRHATSKISTEDDLSRIATLGFRGEALSSIAAVSKLEIYTKTKAEETGTYMIAQNGEIIDIVEAGCPDGTTVLVRELFCTVPARMKFLKKDYTEAGYIEDIVARLALSHPEISVKFINNGKEIIFTPGDNQLSSAIYAVYGRDIKDAMVEADYTEGGVRVFGMCAKAQASRANRNMENFFVNGRYIKSALLAHAVEEAYKNELMVKKFPACVLNVELSPEMVDINIHPTKLEAKFADEKAVYHAVYWATKNALYKKAYVPKVSEEKPSQTTFTRPTPQVVKETFKATPEVKKELPKIDFTKVTPVVKKEPVITEQAKISFGENTYKAPEKKEEPKPEIKVEIKEIPKPVIEIKEPEIIKEKPVFRICGQVFNTYIMVEKDEKLLMVDQHAAHERLRYEKLLAQYRERNIVTQILLMPEIVKLTANEYAVFCEQEQAICELGYIAAPYGEREIIVREIPMEAEETDIEETMFEIISMFANNRKNIDDDLAAKMLYRIACRGAIKANKELNSAEMDRLLTDIFMLDNINTCPHGRPITIEFTKDFIEKQFKRIV